MGVFDLILIPQKPRMRTKRAEYKAEGYSAVVSVSNSSAVAYILDEKGKMIGCKNAKMCKTVNGYLRDFAEKHSIEWELTYHNLR